MTIGKLEDEDRLIEQLPALTAILRRAGFRVTANSTAPYEVAVSYAGGGFDLTCSIVLYEHGVPILSAKGRNPGFGTWIARDVAYHNVFKLALDEFAQRLSGIG